MKIITRETFGRKPDKALGGQREGYLFLLLEISSDRHHRHTLLVFRGLPLLLIISSHVRTYLSRCEPSSARLGLSFRGSFRLPIFRHFQKRAGRLALALSRWLHVLTPSSLRCECSVKSRRPPQPWSTFGIENPRRYAQCLPMEGRTAPGTGNEDAERHFQKRAGRLSLALTRRLHVLTPSSLRCECSVKSRCPPQSR